MTLTALLSLAGLICVSALALAAVWCLRTRRQVRGLREEVNKLTRRLERIESRAESTGGPGEHGLTEKQLAERFETMANGGFSISTKYRHVARLARSGLGVADIAEILEVSKNEAEQMLELAGSHRKTA